jgi:hypothetical protein
VSSFTPEDYVYPGLLKLLLAAVYRVFGVEGRAWLYLAPRVLASLFDLGTVALVLALARRMTRLYGATLAAALHAVSIVAIAIISSGARSGLILVPRARRRSAASTPLRFGPTAAQRAGCPSSAPALHASTSRWSTSITAPRAARRGMPPLEAAARSWPPSRPYGSLRVAVEGGLARYLIEKRTATSPG